MEGFWHLVINLITRMENPEFPQLKAMEKVRILVR
jgi:hypothetical protein